jgi:hypothetical protein
MEKDLHFVKETTFSALSQQQHKLCKFSLAELV